MDGIALAATILAVFLVISVLVNVILYRQLKKTEQSFFHVIRREKKRYL